MAEQTQEIKNKFTPEEIEFCILEESRYEECRLAINEWFASLHENNLVFDYSKCPRLTKGVMEEEIANGAVFVLACIKETNELVGCFEIGDPFRFKDGYPIVKIKTLNTLCVKTEYRRRGLRGLMMKEFEKMASEIGTHKIECSVVSTLQFEIDNLKKEGFELRKSFTVKKSDLDGYVKDMVRDTLTCHCMHKLLEQPQTDI